MIKTLLTIIFIMSLFTFILFGLDKQKAIHHKWRIPEAILLIFSFLLGGIGALPAMLIFHHKTRKWKFRILVPFFALFQLILLVFLLWASDYYHADQTALEAMIPDDKVKVRTVSTGWVFDGPSEDTAFIFYPGAKVEAVSYGPILHEIARKEADVYLVDMPMNLAFFGINRADQIINSTSYDHYYLGGHSLGGAMAAMYAADHDSDSLEGLILLAAYPIKNLDIDVLLLYGSQDRILNMDKVKKVEELAPEPGQYSKYIIEGGNHAQFGNYGKQKGDGQAWISAVDQQKEALQLLSNWWK